MIFTFIFNLEAYFSTKFICALFVYIQWDPSLVNISETIAGDRSNQFGLLTEHKICRKSSRSISIDNRFCNRFINLGRPIFSLNHSGASAATVFTIVDNIRDRACAVLHSRWAGHPICGPSWIIAIWFSFCSVIPLRPKNCICLQSDLPCL